MAIITARGGSKRIPKKNIKEFCGKPIIAYSIEAALGSGVFDEVMVSTDSEEIKAIAEKYGASVPFMRSEATSTDFATTADVLVEVLEEYKKGGKEFEVFACIYPTAPFISSEKLKEAMDRFHRASADSLISVVRFSYPPQRAFIEKDCFLSFQYPENANARSQDLHPLYHDSGQFYISRTDVFLSKHSLVLPQTIPYVFSEEEVQDIDTESDWKIAEMKYKKLELKKMTGGGYSRLSKKSVFSISRCILAGYSQVYREAA